MKNYLARWKARSLEPQELPRKRSLRVAMMLICAAFLIGGCGWSHGTLQVDPTALENVREIGAVRGESEAQSEINGQIEVSNFFVIDVGGTSAPNTLDKAVEILRAQEWSIIAESKPVRVLMKSNKWMDVHLSIAPFDPIYLNDVPDLYRTFSSQAEKSEGLVVIRVYKFA